MKINVEGFSSIDQNPEIRWWDNELWIKEIEKKEGLKIIHNPTTRRKFIDRQLYIDGITDKERKPIKENIDNAYLPISLTNTPVGLQFLATFLQNSTKTILDKCNIRHYDPHTAPFSPDKNLSVGPDDVYETDYAKIAGARFFIGHSFCASTGMGIEMEIAKNIMRIPIIFIPKDIRVSRMMPHRIIYLQYKDFDHQTGKDIEQIIKHLRNFEPGIGFNKHQKPRLFGFGKQGQIVDLQEEIYNKYPQYKFEYDGSKQTVLCDIINAKEITADMRK